MKFVEINSAKEKDSKYLKVCLEKNYEKMVDVPLYVEIRYFRTGLDALRWRAAKILREQGNYRTDTLTVKGSELLAMFEWVCRWADGSFTILIVEQNLADWAKGDKESLEGLSFHVLAHISDMNERDYFSSFPEWAGEAVTEEDVMVFRRASDIVLEYLAEKIALEKGNIPPLMKFREKEIGQLGWLKADLKKLKQSMRGVKKAAVPSRKDYVLSTNLIPLAYKMAWKNSGHGDFFTEAVKKYRQMVLELYSRMEIAEKLKPTVVRVEQYNAELESLFDKTDLGNFRDVKKVFEHFIS